MNTYTKLIYIFFCLISLSASSQIGIGTDNPQGALDITSTTSGVLIPRMTSSDRDAISSPANGLLIFNTSNNAFEVFKTSCACWVTITDGGNTPSLNLENTAPYVNSMSYSGKAIVGQTYTANYVYKDLQNDPEGSTSIQWQIASTSTGSDPSNISGATSAIYTPTLSNAGLYIRAIITPRATSGVLNGAQFFGTWTQVEYSNISTVNNLTVSGTVASGNLLTANYTFSGGNGTENTDPVNGSTFVWQTSATNIGTGSSAPLYQNLSYTKNYIPQSDLLGRYIRVGVRAKDNAGLQATNFVYSEWVGPIEVASDTAPTASNVSYSPIPAENVLVTSSYSYSDANFDPEGVSTFQWYRADNTSGANQVAITGATNSTYLVTTSDVNKYIGLGVTPVAQTGTPTKGTEVIYYNSNVVLPVAKFTFTGSPIKQLPFFASNRAMSSQNSIQVEINVTDVGGAVFSSNTVNGYTFGANFTFNSMGIQWITLTASGTQTAYSSNGDNFTITGTGQTIVTKNITVKNSARGSEMVAFSNGAETFNNNGLCQSALVSNGYTNATCTGSVTVGSNSYNLVHINGQCWMSQNIKEGSINPCASTINTGCNIWSNTPLTSDLGYWGFYNSTTINGSAGWGTTELASGEGILYQWSAAMNGATLERSKGVCPEGYHVPSDCEWQYLEHGLGMSLVMQTTNGSWRTTTGEGSKLSMNTQLGNNSSGFSATLSGYRNPTNGAFASRSSVGYYWTSTESTSTLGVRRMLGALQQGVQKSTTDKSYAYSVRCLRD